MNITTTISGIEGITAKLKAIGDNVSGSNLSSALMEAGELIETACKEYCPVDTGRLRSSIETNAVSDNEVEVAPNTDYAEYVEFGTYKMGAQPYMGPGFESARQAAIDHIKEKLATK